MTICIDITGIVHNRINQVYLERVTAAMHKVLKQISTMSNSGYTIEEIRSRIVVDLRSECLFYLALSKFRNEFERLVRANEMCGYVVDNNDNIHCICSSSWIAQFDGCKEWEIEPC